MWYKVKRWFRSLFVTVKPAPVIVIDETPAMAEERRNDILFDTVDDGSPSNPDWSFIALNMKLDEEQHKLNTIEWYYTQFKKVEQEIRQAGELAGCPWWFIAGIDMREMSFVHDGHFANGDKVIGKNKKTYRVPSGLGPADTWIESVKQTFDYKKKTDSFFTDLIKPDMNFIDACMAWEKYNGYGFRSKGEYSEYVVGFTNFHDETGRYVQDGRYDRFSRVRRCGAGGFVLYLVKKGDVTRKELGLA